MTTAMSATALSSLPYDDVYLDQISSDDDDDDDELDHQNVSISLNKPLMSPRKPKVAMRNTRGPTVWQVRQQKRCLKIFYVIMMISVITLVAFVLFRITNDYHNSLDNGTIQQNIKVTVFPNGTTVEVEQVTTKVEVLPCTHFSVEDVWIKNLPMLQTESAFRLVDVNKDGELDVILGFSTAANGYFHDGPLMCGIYFGGKQPCFGGVMALDGKTGTQLWIHDTEQDIFALNCNVDINKDGVKDCLAAGRIGLFMLLSGATGEALWKFDDAAILESVSNLYTAQFIQDMDGDGVQDVLNIHGGDPFRVTGAPVSHVGKLVIFSGEDGHVISFVEVPDKVESYYSPQVYYNAAGVPMVLFGSGGETLGGSLWVMPLHDIMEKTTENAKSLYTDKHKGVMTPPVLVDLTRDGVEDIVMAMFNSTIVALDGETYKQLWNYSVPSSETYSTPSAGYYNDDEIPDFLIKNNIGPGYPIYYSSEITVLDGRNGRPLLPKPITSARSAQSSALTISMEGSGNDVFAFFNLDCLGHEGEGGSFEVMDELKEGKGGLSRLDFCAQRFNTETYSRLFALSRHIDAPGQSLYNSHERKSDEYQYKVSSTDLAKAYLDAHPTVFKIMLKKALERAKDGGHEEEDVEEEEEEPSEHATTVSPTYTQELLSRNILLAPDADGFTTLSSDDGAADSEEDVEDVKELLDKLQEFLDGLKDADAKEEDVEELPAEEVYGGRYVDSDASPPQKRPFYDKPEWSDEYKHPSGGYNNDRYDPPKGQYNSPNDRYSSPNNDRYDNSPNDRYKLPDDNDDDDDKYIPANILDRYGSANDRYQADVGDRFTPPVGNRYNLPPSRDGYDNYGAKSDILGLLDKYPWLLQELGGETGSPSSDRYPSSASERKRRPDARLPGRQWGRGWTRRRREPLVVGEKPQEVDEGYLKSRNRQRREVLPRENEKHKRRRVDDGGPSPGAAKGVPKQTKSHLPKVTRSHKKNSHQNHHSGAYHRTETKNQLHYQLLKSMEPHQRRGPHFRTPGKHHSDPTGPHHSSLPSPSRGTKRRFRRHAGLHDSGGTMRLISTASLAPSMTEDGESSQSIDIVFATYWFYPSDKQIVLPEEGKCLEEWAANETQRMSPGNQFYGLDHDAYEHEGMEHCIKNDHQTFEAKSKMLKSMNPLDIFPFNIHSGEMTVYRLRLTCQCGLEEGATTPAVDGAPQKRCAKVLPFKDQQWAGYMGTFANSHFQQRRSP